MKRLNKKGFTLIELLAVIVILAIVLVVTIPSVINTMNDARDKSLQNAADTVAEWFTKQYEIQVLGSSLGSGTNDDAYKTLIGTNATTGQLNAFPDTAKLLTKEVLEAAGVNSADTNLDLTGTKSTVYLNGTKVCVQLTAKAGGNFFVNNGGTTYTNVKTSSGC